jgi:hypothetical protein
MKGHVLHEEAPASEHDRGDGGSRGTSRPRADDRWAAAGQSRVFTRRMSDDGRRKFKIRGGTRLPSSRSRTASST